MTDLQRYLVEEWAEDFRDGRLPRREFLRRVTLMAGGTALASAILAEVGVAASPDEIAQAAAAPAPEAQPGPSGVTVLPTDPAIEPREVTYPFDTVTVQAYLVRPKVTAPRPGIVVIHENRGLVEHIRDVARRVAKAGYVALAPDLASPIGGTAKFADLAEVTAFLGKAPRADLVGMLDAGVRFLQQQPGVRRDRIGVVGFCFGGGMTWRLATSNPEIRAAVPFYGPNPPAEDFPKIKAAVLAIYGELDRRINEGIPAAREALTRAGVPHEIVIYPGADHAFHNDTGQRYHAEAAKDAWEKTLAWFKRYLDTT